MIYYTWLSRVPSLINYQDTIQKLNKSTQSDELKTDCDLRTRQQTLQGNNGEVHKYT